MEIKRKGKHKLYYDFLIKSGAIKADEIDKLYADKKGKMLEHLPSSKPINEAKNRILKYEEKKAELKGILPPTAINNILGYLESENTVKYYNKYFTNPYDMVKINSPKNELYELKIEYANILFDKYHYNMNDTAKIDNIKINNYVYYLEQIQKTLGTPRAKEISLEMMNDDFYCDMIQSNPFIFAKHCIDKNNLKLLKYSELTFETAVKLYTAFHKVDEKDNVENLKHIIKYTTYYSIFVVDSNTQKKHMYQDIKEVTNEVINRVRKYTLIYLEQSYVSYALKELINEDKIMVEKNNNGVYLYKDYLVEHSAEIKVNEMINYMHTRTLSNITYDNELEKDFGLITLSDKQMENVENIASQVGGIALLIGSAGTGKTTVAEKILELERKLNPDLKALFVAPTGRASDVLGASLKEQGRTIHSMLNSEEIRNVDLIFVDESSMLDIYIFNEFIKVVNIKTKIIFLGDIKQLESVDKGNILEDMIISNIIPIYELTEVRRQGKDSGVLMLANDIINGRVMNSAFYKDVIKLNIATGTDAMNLLHRNNYFNNIETSQILCPVRKGELGLYNLNELIQKEHQKITGEEFKYFNVKNEKGFNCKKKFCINDKVIITKNMKKIICYNPTTGEEVDIKGVFNGDSGVIVKMNSEKIGIKLNSKYVILTGSEIANVELGYIITINQSQGGGWENVYIISDNSHTTKMVMTKKMYYTAVTRSKKQIHMSIPSDVLRGLIYKSNVAYSTFLADKSFILKDEIKK